MHVPDLFKTAPAVFAVGDTYQIMIPVVRECLMWGLVGNECFYDDANGTLRSAVPIHRITVPRALLDAAGSYTLCWREIVERKAYHTVTMEEQRSVFSFCPVKEEGARAYLIADAHNAVDAPVAAAQAYERLHGPLDFLILAGDIPDHSGRIENFSTIYEIIGRITEGRKPVVYAKGNHDLRGIYADRMDDFTPLRNGCTYFTFRLGSIWGICLDCGEDKPDGHPEYGMTVCCHAHRQRQTAYLQDVIARAAQEYAAPGVTCRLVVVHHPFSQVLEPPFDIEQDVYRTWCALLREHVQPDLMISGHLHRLEINDPGGPKDHLGQPCRSVVGTMPFATPDGAKHFAGTGFRFAGKTIDVCFTDDMDGIHQPENTH